MANILTGKDIDAYIKHSQQYLQNKAKVYSIALGQYTEAMNNFLEGEDTYEDRDGESNVIHILLLLKSIA